MMQKESCALILSALMLTACGGGGGAPSLVRTTIAGTVTPEAPAAGPISASADVLIPPNLSGTWPSIVQRADYTFDQAQVAATRPINPADPTIIPAWVDTLTPVSVNILTVDTQNGFTSITTGAALPAYPALGQQTSITNTLVPATVPNPATSLVYWNVVPYSSALNSVVYSYQMFGGWEIIDNATGATSESYFSAGAPTDVTTIPVSGTATYTGNAAGSFVNAATGEWSDTFATMNATANFAARNISYSTTGTLSIPKNAPTGTPPTANNGLNMNGTLSYAAGSNTFTGNVSTANGMSGNATGRFYGPTIKAGAPAEIGGTFAVMGNGIGAMQGAFGGK